MAAHAFVDDLDAPVLSAEDRHHLERVLRLRPGDDVTVSDGAGGWRRCRFGPELDLVGGVEREPRPFPQVTVAFALVKGSRPEWAVQKLTEVGVDRIVPLLAARSVVRRPEGSGHFSRLRRVAREAAVQSRRTWLPVIDDIATFDAVAAEPGAALAHPGGRPPSLDQTVLLVGPEGGWDARELGCGVPRIGLGTQILRTETAAVVAGTLLCALRSGTVRPADSGG